MKHLQKNNESYISHLLFAGKVGLTLIFRGFIFLFHAIIPICEIPKQWNLSDTMVKLQEWNAHTFRRINK
jgi:hypothetical protein